ncbi:hypothetical protein [Streptomyces sp. t39]|uniref:hypothetical protein n=1 Tax=Streptomyces sp. t39 TaxID=1828156 RepID=UPI0011CDED38|nr:hypothetical protein [Streptomyces sp. t39]TXS35261.1 hypothetical protein EAO77_37220 [Streptomyces sp. t39]
MKELNALPERVIYTAMHGMKPRTGEVDNVQACATIVGALMLDYTVTARTFQREDFRRPHTVIIVATPAGHVTGVYEWSA